MRKYKATYIRYEHVLWTPCSQRVIGLLYDTLKNYAFLGMCIPTLWHENTQARQSIRLKKCLPPPLHHNSHSDGEWLFAGNRNWK